MLILFVCFVCLVLAGVWIDSVGCTLVVCFCWGEFPGFRDLVVDFNGWLVRSGFLLILYFGVCCWVFYVKLVGFWVQVMMFG